MADVKYTDLVGLQYALAKFLEKSDLRFLGIDANAVSATKLNVARKINGVLFDGTADISITADPNAHDHKAEDITDFDSAVTNVITTSNGTIHKHSNLATIEKITESNLTSWSNKIGTDGVANLLYTNVNLTDVDDVKGALDAIVTLYLAVDDKADDNTELINSVDDKVDINIEAINAINTQTQYTGATSASTLIGGIGGLLTNYSNMQLKQDQITFYKRGS